MDDIYKNVKEYNSNKKQKILMVFDDVIADMLSNKKRDPIVTEFFIRGIKLNIYLFYYTIIFCCSKKFRLNSTHFFIMKISKQWELQLNHSLDIDFTNLYKKCTEKQYHFLVIDATVASDIPSRFWKNLLERI